MEDFELPQLIAVGRNGRVGDALLQAQLAEDPQQSCTIFTNEVTLHSFKIALAGRDGSLQIGLLLLSSFKPVLQQLKHQSKNENDD